MPDRRIATVLMLDIVGSTHIAAELGDRRYEELSSRFARTVRAGVKRFGGHEEDQAGDGFFLTFQQPDRAIRCAAGLADELREMGIEIRCGIHTGQTGSQGGKTQGIAVVIGARVMSLADAGEILVTSTTKELVTGSGFGFEDFSAHELKGVPGTWQVFAVTAVDERERARRLPAAEAAERRAAIEASPGRRPPGLALWIAGTAAALLAIVAIVWAAGDGVTSRPVSEDGGAPPPKSLVHVDPEHVPAIVDTIVVRTSLPQLPGTAGLASVHPIAVGQGGIWTVRSFRWLLHVDPERHEVRDPIELGVASFSANVAEGFDKIWVGKQEGLIEVNPATDEHRFVVQFQGEEVHATTADVVTGGGAVWFGLGDGRLFRVEPTSGRRMRREGLGSLDAIAYGHGSLWTADTIAGTVTRYDPGSMLADALIDVPAGVDYLVSGEVAVWALSRSLGSLTAIDLGTNDTTRTVQVGATPQGLAAGLGSIWVGDRDGVLRGIDEDTGQVTEIAIGAEIRGLAFDDETDTIWVDVA